MSDITHKEVSKKGGEATLKKHGKEHYSTMGKLGAEGKRKLYGNEFYKKLSKAGVEARKKKKAQAVTDEITY